MVKNLIKHEMTNSGFCPLTLAIDKGKIIKFLTFDNGLILPLTCLESYFLTFLQGLIELV